MNEVTRQGDRRMTVREIAEAIGKTERSVRNWANKAGEKISSVAEKISSAGHGKAASFNQEETLAIIETGLGKNAAGIFRANAEKPAPDTTSITAIIRETITAMVPVLVEVVRGAIPQHQVAALPAPAELSQRDQLRRVINEYARRSGDHKGAWGELYAELAGTRQLPEYRTAGLETIQRVAEAGGLVMSDRDDVLETYRKGRRA
jgi:hypothetical protein